MPQNTSKDKNTVGVENIPSDAMTSEGARIPYEFLHIVSRRIVYDVTSKPPVAIEWE
jgi:GMP synthase PP-ATPase subunit